MSRTVSRRKQRSATLPSLILQWADDSALPRKEVRSPSQKSARIVGLEAPPWHDTGRRDEQFDFTSHVARLTEDIALRCEELAHLKVEKLLFTMTQARNAQSHGLQARVTPLRFQNGELLRKRRGALFQVQRFVVGEEEKLYLVTFCLPRFLNQTFDEKLITLFHELYHIGPKLDGDLRRHEGRCSLHTRSKRDYDDHMASLARAYLATRPDPKLSDFLRLDFAQLQHRHGKVISVVLPRPKVIPVTLTGDTEQEEQSSSLNSASR